jgi:Predicted methyltransferase
MSMPPAVTTPFILSKAVGPNGRVYAQNTPRGLAFEEDRQDITQGQALSNKIRAGSLDNVTQVVSRIADLPLPAASLDAVMLAQTLHDSYNGSPQRAQQLLEQLYALLKPGGVIAITDHIGLPGNDNRALHRMQIEQAEAVARAAGFRVERSELLRNRRDDHSRSIFDPRLNRNTDRFLLKLTRPD